MDAALGSSGLLTWAVSSAVTRHAQSPRSAASLQMLARTLWDRCWRCLTLCMNDCSDLTYVLLKGAFSDDIHRTCCAANFRRRSFSSAATRHYSRCRVLQSPLLAVTRACAAMKAQQRPDGSFSATRSGSESDMRFLYCACAVSCLLGDWSGVNKDAAAAFIAACTTYEGGVALVPGMSATRLLITPDV